MVLGCSPGCASTQREEESPFTAPEREEACDDESEEEEEKSAL